MLDALIQFHAESQFLEAKDLAEAEDPLGLGSLSAKPVKPQNHESPRQSSTFAWRISYPPTAILEAEKYKAPIERGSRR
jgi:hypothetical protein